MDRVITLRYRAMCSSCGTDLEPGIRAHWDGDERAATCEACLSPDPYSAPRRDVPGRSALREADRQARGQSWRKGGEAERTVGNMLNGLSGVITLHDRRVPGSRSNIDHVAVAASGVWVVDTKHYAGSIRRNLNKRGRLEIGGRDRTSLVTKARDQVAVVSKCLDGLGIPVRGALCFVDAKLPFTVTRFTIEGIFMTTPGTLGRRLQQSGPLSTDAMRSAHDALDLTLRPA